MRYSSARVECHWWARLPLAHGLVADGRGGWLAPFCLEDTPQPLPAETAEDQRSLLFPSRVSVVRVASRIERLFGRSRTCLIRRDGSIVHGACARSQGFVSM